MMLKLVIGLLHCCVLAAAPDSVVIQIKNNSAGPLTILPQRYAEKNVYLRVERGATLEFKQDADKSVVLMCRDSINRRFSVLNIPPVGSVSDRSTLDTVRVIYPVDDKLFVSNKGVMEYSAFAASFEDWLKETFSSIDSATLHSKEQRDRWFSGVRGTFEKYIDSATRLPIGSAYMLHEVMPALVRVIAGLNDQMNLMYSPSESLVWSKAKELAAEESEDVKRLAEFMIYHTYFAISRDEYHDKPSMPLSLRVTEYNFPFEANTTDPAYRFLWYAALYMNNKYAFVEEDVKCSDPSFVWLRTNVETAIPDGHFLDQHQKGILNLMDDHCDVMSVDTLPPLECEMYDGKSGTIQFLGDTIYLVHFWATWCGPCIRQHDELLQVCRDIQDPHVKIIHVARNDDKNRTQAEKESHTFLGVHRIIPNNADRQNKFLEKLYFPGIPCYVLVGKNGKVINRNIQLKNIKEAVKGALAGN